MSNEYDDLVDYGLDDEVHDHEMDSVSGLAESGDGPGPRDAPTDAAAPNTVPSDNELRLAQRVIELEQERDTLAAQLRDQLLMHPTHEPGLPIAGASNKAPVCGELLPVLAVLRNHIHGLTRDNTALRYTFFGQYSTRADSPGSSMATTPLPAGSPAPAGDSTPGDSSLGVDLLAIVERVKILIQENEELGEMVAEAGRVSGNEWLKALDDSKAVIASLDSDLTHNLSVVESMRIELDAYKSRYGSLAQPRPSSGDPPAVGREGSRLSPATPTQHSERQQRDRGGSRGGDRRRNGGQSKADRDGAERDPNKDRRDRETRGAYKWGSDDRRDARRDLPKDDRERPSKKDEGVGGGKAPGASISILGRATGGNGVENGTKRVDDDRGNKRRR